MQIPNRSEVRDAGNWNEVWDSFDSRKRANAIAPANEEASGSDMFGVAAE